MVWGLDLGFRDSACEYSEPEPALQQELRMRVLQFGGSTDFGSGTDCSATVEAHFMMMLSHLAKI